MTRETVLADTPAYAAASRAVTELLLGRPPIHWGGSVHCSAGDVGYAAALANHKDCQEGQAHQDDVPLAGYGDVAHRASRLTATPMTPPVHVPLGMTASRQRK